MISFEAAVCFLCFASSALCAYLLSNAFKRAEGAPAALERLVFLFPGIEQLIGFVDIILLPDLNLIPFRSITALAAMAILLYGFIWEIE